MPTKRFRQKRRNTRRNKNRKGGLLGKQNPNKSNDDNEQDFKKWNAKDPEKYPYYDKTMYYPSSNIFNMGQQPAPLIGVKELKSQRKIDYDKKNKRGFFDDIMGN